MLDIIWTGSTYIKGRASGSHHVRWKEPRSVTAQHSLHLIDTWPPGSNRKPGSAVAFILAIHVQDPRTGAETFIPTYRLYPDWSADNVVAVTFALIGGGPDAHLQGLTNVFWRH